MKPYFIAAFACIIFAAGSDTAIVRAGSHDYGEHWVVFALLHVIASVVAPAIAVPAVALCLRSTRKLKAGLLFVVICCLCLFLARQTSSYLLFHRQAGLGETLMVDQYYGVAAFIFSLVIYVVFYKVRRVWLSSFTTRA